MSKKIISILLVLSMLMSLCTFTVLADGDVLLSYSFESESEGWTYYGKDSTELSDKMASDGKKSLHVNDVSDATGGFVSPMLEAIVGETYTATIDVNSVVSGTNFYLRFSDANKKKIADKQVKPSKTGEWETLTASMAAPEGAVFVHMLVATFGTSFGEAYYDNAKLMGKSKTPVSTGKNETGKKEEAPIVVDEGAKYKTEIGFLTKLGLLDSSFKWDAKITKAEMAKLIAVALHPEVDFTDSVSTASPFNDVPVTHPYFSYIKACRDLGIVKGDYENKFYPDNQISAIEAMVIVINALDYTPYAEAFGGYPAGYYSVASQTGISKSVNIGTTDPINGDTAAKIIYNALFADIVSLSGISNGSIELEIATGKNILSERLGIYEYDAIVIDNGIGSLDGSSMGDTNKSVIKEVSTGKTITAYVTDTNINEYLGYRIKAYVRNNEETGRNEFVYVAPHKKYETLTINAKDIFNVTSNYVEYDEDTETADSEKVALGDLTPVIIINGVRVTYINNQSADPLLKQIMPTDGFVTFIQNDSDSEYDVVNIISFNVANGSFKSNVRNVYADNISTEKDKHSISCAYNPSQTLRLGEDEAGYAFINNDDVKTINDVKQGMVISVAECPELIDGKPYYLLVAHEEKVDSTLSGKSGNTLILADGSELDLSTSLKTNFINYLQMGKAITVYLDVTGKVAYAEGEGGNAKNYAYIVKAVERTVAGQQVMLAKVFTKEGKMLEYPLSEKVRIDGEACDTVAKQKAALNKRYLDSSNALMPLSGSLESIDKMGRPVIIEVKDEKITRIDTDYQNASLNYVVDRTNYLAPTTSSDVSRVYSTQWPIPYSNEDANSVDTLKAGFRSPVLDEIPTGNFKTIAGKFFVTDNSTIIAVPSIDTYGVNYDVYNLYKGGSNTNANKSNFNKDMLTLYSYPETDDNYKVLSAKDVVSQFTYDIQAYDIDPETGVAGLIIIRGRRDCYFYGNVPYQAKNPMQVFSKRTTIYDAEKEKNITKIYYYENGEEKFGYIDLDGKKATTLEPSDVFFPYKAIIDGCDASYTPYGVAVDPLRPGDIVRIIKSGDTITHLERVLRVNDYHLAYTNTPYPTIPRANYTKSFSGIQRITSTSNADYDRTAFPFDMRLYNQSVTSAPNVSIGYVDSYNGSVLSLIGAKGITYNEYAGEKIGKLNDGNGNLISDATRQAQTYVDMGTVTPMVVDFSADGKSVQVRAGTVNDIKTLTEANNKLANSSLVICKTYYYKVEQVIILNGIENVK